MEQLSILFNYFILFLLGVLILTWILQLNYKNSKFLRIIEEIVIAFLAAISICLLTINSLNDKPFLFDLITSVFWINVLASDAIHSK